MPSDFSFFSFLWVPRRPVFDNENRVPQGPTELVSEAGPVLTAEDGTTILIADNVTLNQGDIYRYD